MPREPRAPRQLVTLAVAGLFALFAAATELPDPEGRARDRPPSPVSGTASGPEAPAVPLVLGRAISGRIEESDPASLAGPGRSDRFVVELEGERAYTIDLRVEGWERYDPERPTLGPDAPALVALVFAGPADRPGELVRIDDRMLPGVYSRAHVRPARSGPYVIEVRAEILGPSGSTPTYAGYALRIVEGALPLCGAQDCFHPPPPP